jgi:hypothetical protein
MLQMKNEIYSKWSLLWVSKLALGCDLLNLPKKLKTSKIYHLVARKFFFSSGAIVEFRFKIGFFFFEFVCSKSIATLNCLLSPRVY